VAEFSGFPMNQLEAAEAIRTACLEAALKAYEDAGISGLCCEGRWELAAQAIRCLDLAPLIGKPRQGGSDSVA
jgi:hypothetical protein